MKTVDIKGKKYVEVNERIKYFRENFKNWSLESEIISLENGVCVVKATIKDENQVIKATGLAYEKEGSTFINKTSYIENCETSAWGRALGNLGIGIDTSIASAEEVQNAMNNQVVMPNNPFDEKDYPIPDEVKNEQFANDVVKYGTTELICSKCGCEISQKVYDYSKNKYSTPLCMNCQKEVK